MFDFKDKVVLVTGASGNLGGAVARAFWAAEARLVLLDRHPDRLQEAFPQLESEPERMMALAADVTSAEAMQAAVMRVLAAYGRIDILVHTVGAFRSGSPLHETEQNTYDLLMRVNAATVFVTNQAVLPTMIKQGSGKIINVGARPALQGAKNMAAYSASKAAVLRLTESAAAEVKQYSVNVNAILPGTIDTPQNREAMPKADSSKWVQPESLAGVIQFLASDLARDIHGTAVPVYGRS